MVAHMKEVSPEYRELYQKECTTQSEIPKNVKFGINNTVPCAA